MAVDIGTLRGLLVLDDKFSSRLDLASQKLQTTGKKWEQVGTQLNAVGGSLTRNITVPLGIAAAGALTLSTKFETSLTKIETLVGIAGDEVDRFRGSVLELSGETAKAPKELADALFVVTSAGARGATALTILERAAKASAAGLGDTTEIARAVTAAIAAYGEENLSASRATDILVATVREGNLEASELAGSLGRVIGIAAEVGVSFEQLGGFVATFTRLGVNAEEAITALRGVLNASIAPSEGAAKGLKELGTSADELRRTIREDGLDAALRDLVKRADGNTQAIAKVIPNVRALSGVLGTAGAQGQVFADINDRIANSLGILDEAFGRVTETKGFKFQQFMADLQAVGIRLGDALAPALEKILTAGTRVLVWATKAVDLFAALPSPVQSVALALGLVVLAAGPLLLLAGQLAITVGVLAGSMGALTASTTINTAATISNTAAHAGQSAAMLTSGSRLGKLINLFPSFLTKSVQSRDSLGRFTKSFKVLDLGILRTQFTLKTLTATVLGGLKTALVSAATVIKVSAIAAFAALKTAVIATYAIIAAHPFVLIGAAIAAVAGIIVSFISKEGGLVEEFFADGAGQIAEYRGEWDKLGTSMDERRKSVEFLTEANARLTEAVAAGVDGAVEAQAILREQVMLGEPAEIALGKIAAATNENTDASRLLKGVLIETSDAMNAGARAAAALAKAEEETAATAAAAEAAHAELVEIFSSLGVVTKVDALAGIQEVTTALESGLVPPEQMATIIDQLAKQYEDLGLRGIPEVEAALSRLGVQYDAMNGTFDTAISKADRLGRMMDNLPPFIDDVGLSASDVTFDLDALAASADKAVPPFRSVNDVMSGLGITIPDIGKKMGDLTRLVSSGEAPVRQMVLAIRSQRDEYERLGVLTPELAKRLSELERTALMNATAADKAALGFRGLFDGFETGLPEVDRVIKKFSGILGIFSKIGSALGGLGSKFGSFFSKIGGLFGGGGGGGGGLGFGSIFSSIKGMFGGGRGESVINTAATNFAELLSGGMGQAGVQGASGLLGGLGGILGKAASFLPIVGPLLAAFGGPLLKGIKALGGKIGGAIKRLFGGPSGKELAGRDVTANFTAMAEASFDATQRAELSAKLAAGQAENWSKRIIFVRDAFLALGKTEADAKKVVDALWRSEKQGAEAAQAVIAGLQPSLDAVSDAAAATGLTVTQLRDKAISESKRLGISVAAAFDMIANGTMDTMQASANSTIMAQQAVADSVTTTAVVATKAAAQVTSAYTKAAGHVANAFTSIRIPGLSKGGLGEVSGEDLKALRGKLFSGPKLPNVSTGQELLGNRARARDAGFKGFDGGSRSQPRMTGGGLGGGAVGRNVETIQLVVDGVTLTEIVLRHQGRVLSNKGISF